jgi:hypothetical protein
MQSEEQLGNPRRVMKSNVKKGGWGAERGGGLSNLAQYRNK